MFEKLPENWMAPRRDICKATLPDGEDIQVTQGIGGGSLYFETKEGNYRLGMAALIEKLMEFREKARAEAAHHALTGE